MRGRWRAQAASLHKYMTLHGFDVVIIILLSSGVALSYNVVHSLMIQHTSAVSTTVIGEARRPSGTKSFRTIRTALQTHSQLSLSSLQVLTLYLLRQRVARCHCIVERWC